MAPLPKLVPVFLAGLAVVAPVRGQSVKEFVSLLQDVPIHYSLGIARGSVLYVASNLQIGPEATTAPAPFPLVTSLAGTSAQIRSAEGAIDLYILSTSRNLVRVLVPSRTPLGSANLVVSYGGRETPAVQTQIVNRALGIYREFPAYGYLPATPSGVQNVTSGLDSQANSAINPVRPGKLLMLWGTGLGPAPGDEAAGPIPGDLKIPGLQVLVGVRPAKILYAGRSGCCAGVDQILIEVPEGIEGCLVPVHIRFAEDGLVTFPAFVSIAPGSGACSDPHGLTEAEVRASAAGKLTGLEVLGGGGGWMLSFGQAAVASINSAPLIPAGTCNYDAPFYPAGFAIPAPQDAGPDVRIETPAGPVEMWRQPDTMPGFPGGSYFSVGLSPPPPIEPGSYSVQNGAGSAEIGPVRFSFQVPSWSLEWTNRAEIAGEEVSATDGSVAIQINWSGGDASGLVVIRAASQERNSLFSSFVCIERADKGEFSFPAYLIPRRATVPLQTPERFGLSLSYVASQRIAIPEFDVARWSISHFVASETLYLK